MGDVVSQGRPAVLVASVNPFSFLGLLKQIESDGSAELSDEHHHELSAAIVDFEERFFQTGDSGEDTADIDVEMKRWLVTVETRSAR